MSVFTKSIAYSTTTIAATIPLCWFI